MTSRSGTPRNGDWIESTRRAVPVLLMMSGFVGFTAAMVKWLALGDPQPALMGICATAASGGYLWQAAVSALRAGPPAPPAPPVHPAALDMPPDPPAPATASPEVE